MIPNPLRPSTSLNPLYALLIACVTPMGAAAQLPTVPISFDRMDAATGSVRENDRWGDVLASGDFNGDGYVDQAIGVPSGDLIGASECGFVDVIYGSASGLTSVGSQTWSQENDGLGLRPDDNDRYGAALAVGDFDGDGYDDLAVGVPNKTVDGQLRAGLVALLFGSASGLTNSEALVLDQQLGAGSELEDTFGFALAAGDFNGDAVSDLAVGHPGESYDSVGTGAVTLLYGADRRTDFPAAAQWFHQETDGVVGADEAGDAFGKRLAAGDFDGDGFDELAVGVPNEDIGNVANAGAVVILRGSARGIDPDLGTFSINQGIGAVSDSAQQGDLFGWSLASGDFDGDSRDDLAIGIWGEDGDRQLDSGAVYVQYGSSSGLTTAGQLFLEEDDLDPRRRENGDGMGFSLAAGDFDGDGYDDLVVGAAEEDVDNAPGAGTAIDNAGVAYVLSGSRTGLDWPAPNLLTAVTPSTEERFGWTFGVGDFDGSGSPDLAVSARNASARGVTQAGRIDVFMNQRNDGDGGGGVGNDVLLGDRFRVSVRWSAQGGASGDGLVVSRSDDSVLFYFLDPDNWEMLVKVLDGCGLNQRFWVFFAATTDLGLTVTVEDTFTGARRVYSNPLGQAANTVNDTAAFPCS